MPDEVVHDAAAAYIVAKGVIRGKRTTTDWLNAFKSDMVLFLSAVATQAGNLFSSYSITADESVINLKTSSVASNFRLTCEYPTSGSTTNCRLRLRWGEDHVYNLFDEDDFFINRPIYWVIYKGIASSGEAAAYAPDIMITLGRVTTTLPTNPSDYTLPTEEEWVTIKDSLCKYTPASLLFVNVLNSLTNNLVNCGVVWTAPGSTSNSLNWTSDSSKEQGKRISGSNGAGFPTYYASQPSSLGAGINRSNFACGDSEYYPAGTNSVSGSKMNVSQAASIDYFVPIWSYCSACVSVNSKWLAWGWTLNPNEIAHNVAHRGPNLVNLGTAASPKYYLRCLDLIMPVSAPPE